MGGLEEAGRAFTQGEHLTCERRQQAQAGLGRRSLTGQLSSGSGKRLLLRGPSWGAGAPPGPSLPRGAFRKHGLVFTVRDAPQGSSPRGGLSGASP